MLTELTVVEFDEDWDELPIAELHQLDALCDRFEQAFASDPSTRIEAFVLGLSQSHQRLAVLELMRHEIERRSAEGNEATADEYARRFPQWAEEVRVIASPTKTDSETAMETATVSAATPDASSPSVVGSDTVTDQPVAHSGWSDEWSRSTAAPIWSYLPIDGVLGHYRLQTVIGRGGMGLVVRARDTKLARDVAIKFPSPQIAHDSGGKARFQREAQAAAAIQHSHVATIHAVETIDQIPFFVMEYVDGQSLEDHLRASGPLTTDEVLAITIQILQGLSAAHRHGVIHRDVKPANILLKQADPQADSTRPQSKWHVKIVDFGLARVNAELPLTDSGMIAGTPQYMSPEQASGQAIDSRSDLFSLGSVMYAMCAGRAPFEADSPIAIVRQVADKPALPLGEVNSQTPNWLINVIDRLMAKLPSARFQSADELIETLSRCSADLQTGAADVEPHGPFVRAASMTAPMISRYRTLAIASLLAACAAIAFIKWTPASNNSYHEAAHIQPRQETFNGAAGYKGTHGWRGWPESAPEPAIAPLDSDQAKSIQVAWARHLGVPIETTNSIGMKLTLIPPGEFSMGSDDAEIRRLCANGNVEASLWRSEGPQHQVCITQPFLAGVYEVTRGQFRMFVDDAKYVTDAEKDGKGGFGVRDGKILQDVGFVWNANPGFTQNDDHPVLNVSWNDAVAFCEWLAAKEGVPYRLPTEAQWEYACRAGTTTLWYSGDDDRELLECGWLSQAGNPQTSPVGRLRPNPWSLYDAHGNLWEWCADRYDSEYYSTGPDVDPQGPSHGFNRVYRGGGWFFPPSFCRSAVRYWGAPASRNSSIGFRVIAEWPPQPALSGKSASGRNEHRTTENAKISRELTR